MLSRMRIVILIAVLTGTSATFALFKYLQKQKENFPNAKSSFVSVVVAKTQLPMGKKLSMEDLTTSHWPRDIVPEGNYTEIPILLNRVLKTEVFQGEAILESKLAPKGSEGGFSSIIPPGMRALTVSVNSYSGVSGFILPNTHVDVLVTVPSPNQKNESSTRIILEDIKVLAVDQTFTREDDNPVTVQSVTLVVTPSQAEKLVLASTEGKLQLSLRNNADRMNVPTVGVKLKELVAQSAPVRVYTRPASKDASSRESSLRTIEVIRSGERSEIKVEDDKSK